MLKFNVHDSCCQINKDMTWKQLKCCIFQSFQLGTKKDQTRKKKAFTDTEFIICLHVMSSFSKI